MIDLNKLQHDVYLWSNATFGNHRTALPIAYHLQKETNELIEALKVFYEGTYSNDDTGTKKLADKFERIKMEYADCFMLLIDSAAHLPLSMDGLIFATDKKLNINKARKWGKPDENGVVNHLPDESEFPEIDFRRDIANELSRDELINRLCEMNEVYTRMREEWLKTQ